VASCTQMLQILDLIVIYKESVKKLNVFYNMMQTECFCFFTRYFFTLFLSISVSVFIHSLEHLTTATVFVVMDMRCESFWAPAWLSAETILGYKYWKCTSLKQQLLSSQTLVRLEFTALCTHGIISRLNKYLEHHMQTSVHVWMMDLLLFFMF